MARTFSKEELSEILRKHKLWLYREDGGERANLSEADLRRADLSGADLTGADLSWADLTGANLRKANLGEVNLHRTDLCGADLSGVKLCGADLYRADLTGANLYKADLYGANLSEAELPAANITKANLSGADLCGANLTGANLSEANLSRADITKANLSGADLCGSNLYRVNGINLSEDNLFCPMACPDTGSFIGWKKVPGPYIVKLLIPENAKRSSATGRKCRCDKAKIIAIENIGGTPSDVVLVHSSFDASFEYKVGSEVRVDDFDENRFNECAPGIHFFINRQEAVNYYI